MVRTKRRRNYSGGWLKTSYDWSEPRGAALSKLREVSGLPSVDKQVIPLRKLARQRVEEADQKKPPF